jgi:4-amino-4-deoxy-L-arabinose transferase-like glycosyltransferase
MAARALVGLQIAAIVVLGVATVVRLPVWGLVDEAPHYDYVQTLAEDSRLPRLDGDLLHDEVLALDDGTYPGPPAREARERGLAGRSYEAFQPPLYYLLATPVFAVAGDHEAKLFALRGLGLALLLGAVAVAWLLTRRLVPGDPLPAFGVVLTVFLWPGVVVRAVTVSNAALEMLLGTALSLALWRALAERSDRWLVGAGAITGAALLTKLTTIAFIPSLALVCAAFLLERRWRPVAFALAIPAITVTPWLASNLERYGSFTATDRAQRLLEPAVNPTRRDFGVGDLPGKHLNLLNGVLPEEWWLEFLSSTKRWIRNVLVGGLVAIALALVAWAPPAQRRYGLAVLLLPLVAGVLLMSVSLLVDNWDVFLPRYLYPALPGAATLAALGLATRASRRTQLVVAGATSVLLLALWLHLSTVTPFTR